MFMDLGPIDIDSDNGKDNSRHVHHHHHHHQQHHHNNDTNSNISNGDDVLMNLMDSYGSS